MKERGYELMLKRMPYRLWKSYYRQFPADQYDQASKTILVELPDVEPVKWPKDWRRDGNRYITPGGCDVCFWNTGLAQNFEVRKFVSSDYTATRTIHPGIDIRQRVLKAVEQLESLYAAP